MSGRRGRQLLAAPALGDLGGGVGQVAALLWAFFEETWPATNRLLTLDIQGSGSPAGRIMRKLRFGTELAASQMSGGTEWILFAHLGLMRAQRVLPRALRAPYGVFLHGVESWQALPRADVQLLRQAAVRLANSEFTAARVQHANPEIGEVVTCQLALPGPARVRAIVPVSRPQALIVGRLSAGERYKGHDALIDVWPAVVDRVPGAALVIAGDGDDRDRLEQRAAASVAAPHIRFTGFIDRAALDRLYDESAVFVLPSRGEGFGLVYLEAMAHGRACIGSRHDAAREIVVDGETGLLVDPDEPRTLVEALVRLLTDGPFRAACGSAGQQRWLTHFTRDRFNDRVRAALDRAFQSSPARPAARQAAM